MWLLGSPRLALVLLFCCSGAVQSRRTPPNSSDAAAGGGQKHHGHLRHEQHRRAGADATKASDHLVTKLPGLQDGALTSKQYAGYIPVKGGKLFYWLFESANKPALDPLVIWLNGGPGCSSMDGLFLENGPLQLTGPEKKDLTVNMYSWHNVANVLYVDQPVGTGLSITADDTYADSEAQVDANFYAFLQGFVALHPSLASRALYFTGESHAGHYIPSMITYILDANARVTAAAAADGGGAAAAAGGSSAVVLNVKGAAIGNGWTAPRYQYDVSEYAFGAGLVAEGQLRALQVRAAACRANIDKKNYRSNVCYELLDAVVEASGPQGKRACIYDVRRFGYDFPPGRDAVQDYLNRADVRAALHVADDPAQFQECTDPPFYHLAQWDGLGVMPQVASILEAGQRLLFFNGQHDLICNHVGNERWLSELSWSGAQAYRESDRGAWVVESGDMEGPAGYYKSANNGLAYLLVRGAGHMVPMDVPKAALDMLTRFLNEKSFVDYAQDLKTVVGPWLGLAGDAPECPQQPPPQPALPSDPPSPPIPPPTIDGTPQVNLHAARIAFTAGEGEGADTVAKFVVMSSPGGLSAEGGASPLVVKGLTPGETYTFSVTAVTADGRSSAPSPGSKAVTPGCSVDFATAVCSDHGACVAAGTPDAPVAACLCRAGWGGDYCNAEAPSDGNATVLPAGGAKPPACGEGGGGEGAAEAAIAEMGPDALPVKGCPKGHVCDFDWEFDLSAQAFPAALVASVSQGGEGGVPTPERAAFEALLVGDVGQALSLPTSAMSLASVAQAGGDGALQLRLRLTAVTQDMVKEVPPQWNLPESALHTGVFTRFIDFSAPTALTLVADLGAGEFSAPPTQGDSTAEPLPRNRGSSSSTIIFVLGALALFACGAGAGWMLSGVRRRAGAGRGGKSYELAAAADSEVGF